MKRCANPDVLLFERQKIYNGLLVYCLLLQIPTSPFNISLSVCLVACLCVSDCFSLSVFLYNCVSVFLSLSLSPSHSISLSFSLSLLLSFSIGFHFSLVRITYRSIRLYTTYNRPHPLADNHSIHHNGC